MGYAYYQMIEQVCFSTELNVSLQQVNVFITSYEVVDEEYSVSHKTCTWYFSTQFDFITAVCGSIWKSYPYSSGLFHWHWGNHMIAPVPVK